MALSLLEAVARLTHAEQCCHVNSELFHKASVWKHLPPVSVWWNQSAAFDKKIETDDFMITEHSSFHYSSKYL